MFSAVLVEGRKAGLPQQLLLAEEVHARELGQAVKQLGDSFAAATTNQRHA
jgi:hypothetical protein